MNLGTQTIIRKARPSASTEEDEYGNPIPGAPGDDLPIPGCSVQPGAGVEVFDRRDALTTVYTVWAPITADVIDTDQIAYAGTVYDIDGPVQRWEVGTALDHLVIRLKAVSG
jgi:hypothetical protein